MTTVDNVLNGALRKARPADAAEPGKPFPAPVIGPLPEHHRPSPEPPAHRRLSPKQNMALALVVWLMLGAIVFAGFYFPLTKVFAGPGIGTPDAPLLVRQGAFTASSALTLASLVLVEWFAARKLE